MTSDFPQWRVDPITGRTVIAAPARQARPHSHGTGDGDFDPFLEGNESETPPEILAVRSSDSQPNQPGWQIRVVPNRFAAVMGMESLPAGQLPGNQGGRAFGIHDVIIECPHYEACLSRLPVQHVGQLFTVYRDRLRMLSNDDRIVAATLFKNKGPTAGASLGHAHSQIIATQFVSQAVAREIAGCEKAFAQSMADPFDQLIQDSRTADLVVAESPDVVALCPKASRFPFEVWLIPKSTGGRFDQVDDSVAVQTGYLMHEVLRRIDRLHVDPPYNYVLHTLPFQQQCPAFRWHFELYPRLAGVAGYELGADCFINAVPAEDAAKRLRDEAGDWKYP